MSIDVKRRFAWRRARMLKANPSAAPERTGSGLRLAVVLTALTAFLPFARGLLAGQCFYFRDLSLHFFPMRRFAVQGLLEGRLHYWNPLVHEGVPASLPPVSYPLDLLHLLAPDEWGFSLILALHVPLAAVAFLLLARSFGLALPAAAGGGLVYALGGFSVSTINLYVYAPAMAWTPLLILSLRRAIELGWRRVPAAALCGAVAISTAGVEIVIQAIAIALVLNLRSLRPREWVRASAGLGLAVGLAAPTLFVMGSLVSQTDRGRGFATDVVLTHSVHPLSLAQVLVGSWHGDPASLAERWWGHNFFPRGFPYVLSLYLGPTVVALALVGLLCGGRPRGRLGVLLLVGLVVSLGRWAGLRGAVDALPFLHQFRYPVKAFFTVHFALALLAAIGLGAVVASRANASRWLGIAGCVVGGLLVAAPLVPMVFPGWADWFSRGFFHPGSSPELRAERLSFVVQDAALGGALAVVAGGIGLAVRAGHLRPFLGALTVLGLLSGDLLRTGASLNPMVSRAFYRLSPEMTAAVESIRSRGGRIFTCRTEDNRAYWASRQLRLSHEAWTFAAAQELLTPHFNMKVGLPAALGEDLTSLVPLASLPPRGFSCSRIGELVDRLREAAVTHVLSLDPLEHPALALERIEAPERIAPLAVHVYALRDPLPIRSLDGAPGRLSVESEAPGRIVLAVDAEAPAAVRLRQSCAPGWTATVDGAPARLQPMALGHCSLPVPAGRTRVELVYRPPGLATGLSVGGVSLLVVLWLAWSTRRQPQRETRGTEV